MKRLKKKKPSEDGSPPLKIVWVLSQGRCETAYGVAKAASLPVNLVDYHLKKLVANGIVLTANEKKKIYFLRPFFYDAKLDPLIEALVTAMYDNMVFVTKNKEAELSDNLAFYLRLLTYK